MPRKIEQRVLTNDTRIKVPSEGYKLLYVSQINNVPTVWFEVASGECINNDVLHLIIKETGDEVPEDFRYVDSVITHNGKRVNHIYGRLTVSNSMRINM